MQKRHKTQKYKKKPKKNLRNKYKTRKYKKIIGGYTSTYEQAFTKPTWTKGVVQWTTLVTVGDKFYGTSLPSQNFYEAYSTLYYYFYVRGIKRILSLHGCSIVPHAKYCDGYIPQNGENLNNGRNSEKLIWESFINQTTQTIEDKDKYAFIEEPIEDMTPGTLTNWKNITSIEFDNVDSPLLIHCLAGFGRTGSILLYGILRQIAKQYGYDVVLNNIKSPYLGSADLMEMFEQLRKLMEKNLHVIDDTILPEFNINNLLNEFFNISNEFYVNLLITRLNYIFIYVSHFCGASIGTQIYLLHMKPPNIDGSVDIDSVPVTITDTLLDDDRFGFVL